MSEDENALAISETQLKIGKKVLYVIAKLEASKWINSEITRFKFYGHKYKMTIEKDNGDE